MAPSLLLTLAVGIAGVDDIAWSRCGSLWNHLSNDLFSV
jgi:hypothetical protein